MYFLNQLKLTLFIPSREHLTLNTNCNMHNVLVENYSNVQRHLKLHKVEVHINIVSAWIVQSPAF